MADLSKGRLVEPLAVRSRPKTLEALIGQDATVSRIRGFLKKKDIPNAILLAGGTGTGKTTTARIIARTLNCDTFNGCGKCRNCLAFDKGTHPDYSETNVADERGIDDMRAMIKKSSMMPTMGVFRVFCLDEFHAATPQAQAILLKPLENPPARTLWILGSMSADKIEKAIVGRCQTYNLKPLDRETMTGYLEIVAKDEGYDLDTEVLDLLSDMSGGHTRNALQALESVMQYVDGLEGKKKDLTKLIKANVIQGSLVDADDTNATKAIYAMVTGNQKTLQSALLSTQSHIAMSNKLMYQLSYCLSQLLGVSNSNVWHSPVNKEAWLAVQDALVKRGDKAKWSDATVAAYARVALVDILASATRCRTELQNFVVPEAVTAMAVYHETVSRLRSWEE